MMSSARRSVQRSAAEGLLVPDHNVLFDALLASGAARIARRSPVAHGLNTRGGDYPGTPEDVRLQGASTVDGRLPRGHRDARAVGAQGRPRRARGVWPVRLPDNSLALQVAVSDLAPRLADSGYDGVSLLDVLTMSSGARWSEDYGDPDSETRRQGSVLGRAGHWMTSQPRSRESGR